MSKAVENLLGPLKEALLDPISPSPTIPAIKDHETVLLDVVLWQIVGFTDDEAGPVLECVVKVTGDAAVFLDVGFGIFLLVPTMERLFTTKASPYSGAKIGFEQIGNQEKTPLRWLKNCR